MSPADSPTRRAFLKTAALGPAGLVAAQEEKKGSAMKIGFHRKTWAGVA